MRALRHDLVLVALLLLGVAGSPARAGHEGHARATGSKFAASKRALRRNAIGPTSRPVPIAPAPAGRRLERATSRELRGALRRLRGARPGLRVRELAPGYQRYRSIVGRVRAAGQAHPGALRTRRIGRSGGLSILRVDLVSSRPPQRRRPRVLIVGGVHGDEPGHEVATRFIEKAAKDRRLRDAFDITVIPMLSPTAMVLGTRQSHLRRPGAAGEDEGVDVNRTFADGLWTAESAAIRELARDEQFDLVIDLHGAGGEATDTERNGFFLIGHAEDRALGERILRGMGSASLMDVEGAGGRPTRVGPYPFDSLGYSPGDWHSPTLRSHMARIGVRHAFVLEAPMHADPAVQVRGLTRLMLSTMHNVRRHGDLGP